MGIGIKKTHTKFEDLILKIGKVPAILRFDQFYKANCLEMAIFSHILPSSGKAPAKAGLS